MTWYNVGTCEAPRFD